MAKIIQDTLKLCVLPKKVIIFRRFILNYFNAFLMQDHFMLTYRLLVKLLLVSFLSLVANGCSRFVIPGMPNIDARYTPRVAPAKPNIDYKLIPLNSNVIKKQKITHARKFIKHGRPAGIGGYTYRVGPQDILSITVWDHPELTIPAGEFRSPTAAGHKVGSDGRFFFPYAGKIQAAGRTTSQIRRELEQKLAKFITKPQVGVSIAAYRSQQAYISGSVLKPGVYSINDVPLTIRDIIAKSGGLTEKASDFALFTHHKKKIKIDLDALYRKGDNSQNYIFRGGDSLHIAEKNTAKKVFVMGEVVKPGSILVTRFGMSLAEALSDSGGLKEETANPTGIFVVRQETRKDKLPSVYQLQLTSVHSMLLAEQFSLRPRDVVYVTATPVTRWSRVIGQLLSTPTILNNTDTLLK